MVAEPGEPTNYDEAQSKEEWKASMQEEISAIVKNETWELVNLPKGKSAIGLKWVYKVKYAADGEVQRYKSRLVAKGYVQRQGVDYVDTYSPVARYETVRIILGLAAQNQWSVFQFDVKSAFLNGSLEEDVYVDQPEGFVVEGQEEKVYKLKKALYGLKQAPRAWYGRLDAYLRGDGFHRSDNEPTLYVKVRSSDDIIIVCVYVDDIIYTSSSTALIEEFRQSMTNEFEMSDLGLLRYFLGFQVEQTTDRIFLKQEKYALDLLKRFNMENCKTSSTPMNTSEKLIVSDGTPKANESLFRSLVGGLMYLTNSRPDIAFPVSLVSRFMHNPTMHHLGAAKRILRYIRATSSYGIWYRRVSDFRLMGYTDSDWAGFVDDRKSTSGYVFNLGSGAVSWLSRKQATVALSSSEAEYIAATSATCQAIWMRRILADLHHVQGRSTDIYCDNKATISMTKNPVFHGRTKHIELRHHFIRDVVKDRTIVMKYCPTDDQVADGFTKALSYQKFDKFRSSLNVSSFCIKGE